MSPKQILIFILLLCVGFIAKSQTLSCINLEVSTRMARVTSIDLNYNNTIYCVDLNGNIIQDQAAPVNFSVARYTIFDGQENSIGKLKSIGSVNFTYYTVFDGQRNNIGKLKSIGSIAVSYYTEFDGQDNIGKLKSVGGSSITYYNSFDISQPMGTIKSVSGNAPHVRVIDI